jgi:hypothetical protein
MPAADDIMLVRASFARVALIRDAVADLFYGLLFEVAPQLRPAVSRRSARAEAEAHGPRARRDHAGRCSGSGGHAGGGVRSPSACGGLGGRGGDCAQCACVAGKTGRDPGLLGGT